MDFSFGTGNEELGAMAMGRVWGEDVSSLSGLVSNRPPTNFCSVVFLFEVQHCQQSFRGVKFEFVYLGRGTGGTAEVTANTACSSSLYHLRLVLRVFLLGVPNRGGILQDWVYSALALLQLWQ